MRKRSLPVTLLVFSVLSLTVWNAIRFGTALTQWAILTEFARPPGPLYLALTGLFWTLAGAAVIFGFWFSRKWARPLSGLVGSGYITYYWLDRLLIQNNRSNWPFMACLSLLWLTFFMAMLFLPKKPDFLEKEKKDE
ncbi:MAG: hypothetical protein ACUVRJ_00765 [Candidatus Villigracilaceae bacterium]